MKKVLYILLATVCIAIFYYCFVYYEVKNEDDIAILLGNKEAVIISTDYTFYPFISLRDGDTIEMYRLSDSTIKNFVQQSSFELYDDFYENNFWLKENWHRTPIDSIKWKHEYIAAFAPRIGANKKFNLWSKENQRLLLSSDAYYAFYYKDDDIIFYVLDIINKVLYITSVFM